MYKSLCLFISVFLANIAMLNLAYATHLKISTSIQPLGLMLTELTQHTSADIQVLIPPYQSSHDFSLRPKDIVQLNQADLILWVGPELENFLTKPIQALSESKPNAVLTLLTIPSIKKHLLNLRAGAQWQDVHHEHADHGGHEHNHAEHYIDPHIWLSPELNLNIAHQITKKLIALNPSQASLYFANFKNFAHQLISLDELYRQAFDKKTQPLHRYLVLHDSYQYLENQYNLTISGVLSIHPDRPASIKMLREAQQNIRASQVTCILGEPPFQTKLIQVLLEGQADPKPKFVQLSPLADKFELKLGNYEKWQLQMIYNIEHCE